jgi:hypothetical protein
MIELPIIAHIFILLCFGIFIKCIYVEGYTFKTRYEGLASFLVKSSTD